MSAAIMKSLNAARTFARITTVALAFAATATSHAQTTVTLQHGLNAYTGATDTYINSSSATTNFGTTTPLQDQTNARGLLVRFKIFAADGGPVPNGATIQSATLSLYKSAGGATTFDARRVLKSWIETQATWNRATSTLNWSTAGATGSGTDLLATADGSASTTTAAGWLAFNVTTGVAAMSAGAANNGWRLVPTAGATNAKSFHSREYTTNTTLRPKLAITYTVPNVPPTVNLTAPVNGATATAPATIALAATAADSDGTITKVEFYRGATLIATDTTAPFTGTDANVAAGTYSYTAKAYDNAGGITTSTAASVTVNVPANVPPAVSLTAPANGAVLLPPATIALAATAADSDGTITKVEFYRGATLVATATAAPYTASDAAVAPGTYAYTAKAYDNGGATTTTAAASVRVDALPAVSLTAPVGGASYSAPASITLTASATDSDGTIVKVEFYRGTTLVGTANAAPFTVADANVAATAYSYTAKAYDNDGGITTSAPVNVTVTPPQALYYIHADHLGTPRAITRPSDNAKVWEWSNSEPFGNNAPNEDPANTGTAFKFNLRFSGQYYDAETGTHYNYFRDYDPSTGRYIESDPSGLRGGINTYAYVLGNPLTLIDPFGLQSCPLAPDPCPELIAQVLGLSAQVDSRYTALLVDQWSLYAIAYSTKLPGKLAALGTWRGHIEKYEGLRVGLSRAIARAEAAGCAVPPQAYVIAARPPPPYPNPK
jgi:RHS repeat-associated protein